MISPMRPLLLAALLAAACTSAPASPADPSWPRVECLDGDRMAPPPRQDFACPKGKTGGGWLHVSKPVQVCWAWPEDVRADNPREWGCEVVEPGHPRDLWYGWRFRWYPVGGDNARTRRSP